MSAWELVKLGQLCKLVNGDAYRESDWSTTGLPIVRIQNLNDETKPFNYWQGPLSGRVLVGDGDVLLAWSGTPGTSFGAHIWNRGKAVLNQHIFRVDLDKTRVHPNWAVFAINNQLDQLIGRAHGAVGLRHVTKAEVESLPIPLPDVVQQTRIAGILNQQTAAAEKIRASLQDQKNSLQSLLVGLLRGSLQANVRRLPLGSCLREVNRGIGDSWRKYPVLGATRSGLAPAKETIGKQPHRYKLVDEGTVFYNPMRILLGSIATIDMGDTPGITSPDYVVFKCEPDILHHRWFYHWLRSHYGEAFIKGLTRGAVRERLLFKRLAAASIEVPPIEVQQEVANQLPLIRGAIRKIEEQIKLSRSLPSAHLRRAFTGEF